MDHDRCEVTGKVVLPGEMIELMGRHVCAEGKAILLERLRCGLLLPGAMETPPFSARLMAFLQDCFCLWLMGFIMQTTMLAVLNAAGAQADLVPLIASLLSILIWMLYPTLMHAYYNGQTLGKRANHIRVVKIDGSPLTLGRSIIRTLVYQGPGSICTIIFVLILMQEGTGMGFMGMSGSAHQMQSSIALVVSMFILLPLMVIYFIVNAIVALLDKTAQLTIHDRVASTRVIVTIE